MLQSVTLPWGGEERVFQLRIGELRALQAKCDAGPEEIAARLAPTVTALDNEVGFGDAVRLGLTGRWRIDDVRETLLQGLIGGGMAPQDATVLVLTYVDGRPLRENAAPAYLVLMAAISGVPDEPGKVEGEGATADPTSPDESSGSATSTAPARGRGSRRAKSMPARSGNLASP